MDKTERYTLGCVLSQRNILESWKRLRSRLPHPCVFASQDANAIAVVLDYATESYQRMDGMGFYSLLSRIPYFQFRELLREIEAVICQQDDTDYETVRHIIRDHASLAIGDADLTEQMSVQEHLCSDQETFFALTAAPIPYDSSQIAEIILRQYAKHRARVLSDQLQKAIQKDDFDVAVWAERCRASLARVATSAIESHDVGASADTFDPTSEDRVRQTVIFGLDSLDKALVTPPGSLIVVSAPQGCGKSALLWQSAVDTARRLPGNALYYSFEMSRDEHMDRLHSRVGRLDWQMVADRIRGKLALVDNSNGPMTVEAIIGDVKRRHMLDPTLTTVYVDHIGLIKRSLRDNVGLSEQTGHITTNLKLLSGQLGITTVVAAQQTRDGRREIRNKNDGQIVAIPEPRVSDLYGGTYIESDASHVLFIWPQVEDETPERKGCVLKVAKHRHGPTFSVNCGFYGAKQLISEEPEGYVSAVLGAYDEDDGHFGYK